MDLESVRGGDVDMIDAGAEIGDQPQLSFRHGEKLRIKMIADRRGENIDVARKAVETNFVLLWEFDPANGLRLTRSIDDPLPIRDYLEVQGKYRHLSPEQVTHIEAEIARQNAFIAGLERQRQVRALP